MRHLGRTGERAANRLSATRGHTSGRLSDWDPAVRQYRGLTRRVEAVYAPEQIPAVMRRAFHALRNGPSGLVAVEMAELA